MEKILVLVFFFTFRSYPHLLFTSIENEIIQIDDLFLLGYLFLENFQNSALYK